MDSISRSRRRFLQYTAALGAVTPALAAAAAPAAGPPAVDPVAFGDREIVLEFDAALRCRVARGPAESPDPLGEWSDSERLELAGHPPLSFARVSHEVTPVDGVHGRGRRLRVVGRAADAGLEKTVDLHLYDRHPGLATVRTAYRNASDATRLPLEWVAVEHALPAAGTESPAFWSYSGGSYADRRDWVRPLAPGYRQQNFMGMTAADYGSGTPVVDVWRRDAGLAVGHLELRPREVSLPLEEDGGRARVAVRGRPPARLAPGEAFETVECFVAVHRGDYFATLERYRRLMAERGLRAPVAPAASYEPIWCAWGYERDFTPAAVEGTLPKVKDLGFTWAVLDDGWQAAIGDWRASRTKFPGGDAELAGLARRIREQGLKPRLWFAPLAVAPGSDALHEHADLLLLDADGAVRNISWWNSFYLCPADPRTVAMTVSLVEKFLGEWGFSGLKIDGQHLNGVAPCHNPAHHHARPEESQEHLQDFFRAIYEAALRVNPEAVVELCPCGTAYAFWNLPYCNQTPASDPESSWQVRHKGKTLKALIGPSAPYAGDHVELSDHGDDFASTVGIGAVVSTKFTWPRDPKPKDSFLLTPAREVEWRRWRELYTRLDLPRGIYRGELYDLGFDRPETHVVEKPGRLYYSFYADRWRGPVVLRGLAPGRWRVRDVWTDRTLGVVDANDARLDVEFQRFLMLEAVPA
jgi:alpha-galactosidase